MLRCRPTTLFSWNFRVLAEERTVADITFDFLREQGTISHGDDALAVVKHGPLSGIWSLERAGKTLGTAEKPSAFRSRFEMQVDDRQWVIDSKSLFGRGFVIADLADHPIGEIRPAQLFSREATIECDPRMPERDQLFAFWLVALAWRRQARSD